MTDHDVFLVFLNLAADGTVSEFGDEAGSFLDIQPEVYYLRLDELIKHSEPLAKPKGYAELPDSLIAGGGPHRKEAEGQIIAEMNGGVKV